MYTPAVTNQDKRIFLSTPTTPTVYFILDTLVCEVIQFSFDVLVICQVNLKRVKIKLSGTPALGLHLLGFEKNKITCRPPISWISVLSLWREIVFTLHVLVHWLLDLLCGADSNPILILIFYLSCISFIHP